MRNPVENDVTSGGENGDNEGGGEGGEGGGWITSRRSGPTFPVSTGAVRRIASRRLTRASPRLSSHLTSSHLARVGAATVRTRTEIMDSAESARAFRRASSERR